MWTEKKIQELKAQGKIKDYRIEKKSSDRTKKISVRQKPNKAKDWIDFNLQVWCNDQLLLLEREYRFHEERKWRFDWAIPELKIAIEYEGIHSAKSRHTTKKGYAGDIEKYNAATGLSWRILRYTAGDYKILLKDIETLKNQCSEVPNSK